MLWLAAYLTGFPPVGLHAICWTHGLAPMWSGLYLISTEILSKYYPNAVDRVNALSGLYLISTGKLLVLNDTIGNAVSMPSRAYTSFLRYPFKNLGFMRFPEPVFADIYQNILTTAVFRAC